MYVYICLFMVPKSNTELRSPRKLTFSLSDDAGSVLTLPILPMLIVYIGIEPRQCASVAVAVLFEIKY